MNIEISKSTKDAIELVRIIGKEYLRPLGLEADRLKRPIPKDHPFYFMVAKSGYMTQGMGSEEPKTSKSSSHSEGSVRSVLVAEEGSYWDRGALVSLPGPGLGGPPLARMGTPEQKERFFAPFRQKERPVWAAFAMTEPGAGSDVARITTRAFKTKGGWVLKGQKMYSSNSPRAEWVVVFATIDPDLKRAGHRAFIVEKNTPGFEILRIEHKMGLRAYETATFSLDECFVPDENLLGGESYYESSQQKGFEGAMAAFNSTRPIIASMAVGIARCAYDLAKDAYKDIAIQAFRRKETVLEKLVEMRATIESARWACLKAAFMADAHIPNAMEASIAKAYAPPKSLEVVETACEILGEAGLLNDSIAEKLARDVKALDIVEGTQQIQRRVISKHLGLVLTSSE
jgi:acyl-CoA dehydrogenase